MHELIMIHIYGQDKPGLAAQMTGILAEYDVEILDMGQTVIHDNLSLGILIRIPLEHEAAPIVKEVLFAAHDLEINVKFRPITDARYRDWVAASGKKRYIVTLLGRKVTAMHMAEVTRVLAESGLNINGVTRLSGRMPLTDVEKTEKPVCIELSLRGTPDELEGIRKKFLEITARLGIDIALQEETPYRRNRRMVAFDMDSTLIQAEVIDELAAEAGVGEKVAAITESAMRGEIDFKESLRRRLGLLEGLSEASMQKVAERIPMTDGAERLIANLRQFGYKTAILSGGFTYFGRILQKKLGVDYVYANELEIKDGKLTGKVVGDIVDAAKKAELLQMLAKKEEINLQQVIAVGDGANDLPMLNLAGLGIAFHAKPVVKEGARQSISTLGLDSILYLVGVRDRDTLI
ncbi:phosphoserine phosphatase SerB [Desulfoluna spongiiphila]|uniref:Phosphoserine phosphatase n=1 Tax=Desulfoluna spongiiphila TaxID=419481 RepID=A0A1G5I1L2_9BACT|nr:phosphoserine phosphatase SerB [Desulfoluna spongiiphila]SCY69893.1 phosphoserine phosphatase [Desulfoluna spongiiphila]VVS92636.1 serb: phosphoserine phosphatase serb [Desulfoluna spongiiphila]